MVCVNFPSGRNQYYERGNFIDPVSSPVGVLIRTIENGEVVAFIPHSAGAVVGIENFEKEKRSE